MTKLSFLFIKHNLSFLFMVYIFWFAVDWPRDGTWFELQKSKIAFDASCRAMMASAVNFMSGLIFWATSRTSRTNDRGGFDRDAVGFWERRVSRDATAFGFFTAPVAGFIAGDCFFAVFFFLASGIFLPPLSVFSLRVLAIFFDLCLLENEKKKHGDELKSRERKCVSIVTGLDFKNA